MADRKAKAGKTKTDEVKEILITEVAPAPVEEDKDWSKNETADFSGKYSKAIGRRKQSVAKVRLYEDGKGVIMVNGVRAAQYFAGEGANLIAQPLKVTGHGRDFNFSVLVSGGGKQGQVGAVRLGISRALFDRDPAAKEALKANGFLTRDPRQVERKKPGLRKARKAPQWSKR
jgi:small subunit ribosomal protein S9